jgi:hypothetical protein
MRVIQAPDTPENCERVKHGAARPIEQPAQQDRRIAPTIRKMTASGDSGARFDFASIIAQCLVRCCSDSR